jgi:hypothetical protein
MNSDPEVNCVVFEIERAGAVTRPMGTAPTRSDQAVRTVWATIRREHSVDARTVRRIFSEWEPSAADAAFVAATFPKATLLYSFSRPKDGQWAAALEEVRRAMAQAHAEAMIKEAEATKSSAPLLPVLRPMVPDDPMVQIVVHRPVTAKLAIFLAHAAPTPRGTVGLSWLLTRDVAPAGEDSPSPFDEAMNNLTSGLHVKAMGKGRTVDYVLMQRDGGFAASILADPGLHGRATGWVGDSRILAIAPDRDTLVLMPVGSPLAAKAVSGLPAGSADAGSEFVAGVFMLNATGVRAMRIVAG